MANGQDDEPYDWAKASQEPSTSSRKKRTGRTAPDGKDEKPGARRGLGFIGWLMVLTGLVILSGTIALGWISWNFTSNAQRENADQLGLVPVEKDFAPGRPKPNDVLFRIAGSRHMGERLMPDMVASWMRARGYSNVSISRNDRVSSVSGSKAGNQVRVLIAQGSAHGGFEALNQGRVEAVMSSRRILASEADRLSALGDMTSVASEKIIGLDASLVLVNRLNPITNINGETLGRILSGEVLDWSEVTENGEGRINVKLENLGVDLETSPAGRLLGDREPPDTVQLVASSKAVADGVSGDVRAIGIARRADAGGTTKALSVNERNARSIEADDFSIATETYPLTDRLYIYVGSSNADPVARDFADFSVSPAGQDVVARNNFTAQKIVPVRPVVPPEAPRDYQNFARDAERLNFDIRFDNGSNALDPKAIEDIKRLRDFLSRNQIDQRRIALLGFADNVGARATNLGLAQSRAETAGIMFDRAGINPGIIRAYGDALPVGANSEERGRIRNRRVEVWLCAPPACPLVDLVSQAASSTQSVPSGVRLGNPRELVDGGEPPKG
jgi:phosphate transport system substrate-binding protein